MLKRFRKLISVLMILGIAFGGNLPAGELEQALPESTVLLVKLRNWSESLKAVEKTALGKIGAEEDVQDYLKGIGKALTAMLDRIEKETGLSKTELKQAFGSEIALAFLGCKPLNQEAKEAAMVKALLAMRKNNLRQIGLAIAMYADDNDQKFPKKLSVLFPDYVDNDKIFLIPDYKKHAADGIDYAYISGITNNEPSTIVLGYESLPDKNGKHMVLFCDAHVELLTTAALKKARADNIAGLKKKGRQTTVSEPKGVARGKKASELDLDISRYATPEIAVALIAKADDAVAADSVLTKISKLINPRGGPRQLTWGVKTSTVQKIERNIFLYVISAGDYRAWVISTGPVQPKQLAAALKSGQAPASLADNKDFKLCLSKLGQKPDLVFYGGIKKALTQLLPLLPNRKGEKELLDRVLKVLQVADFTALAGSFSVEAPGFRSRSFLNYKPGPEGLPGLLDTSPLPADFLKTVPAQATAMYASSFRLDRVLPLLRKTLAAGDPRAAKDMDKGLSQLKAQTGFDLENDLLGSLGGRACIYSLPASATGGNPMLGQLNGLVGIVEIKDAEKLRKCTEVLVVLARAAIAQRPGAPFNVEVNQFEYRKQKIVSFTLGAFAAPGFAITDKHLLIAGNVQSLKRAIREAAGYKLLVDSAAYDKAMARLNVKDAHNLSYVNTGSAIASSMAQVATLTALIAPAMNRARGNANNPFSQKALIKLLLQLGNPATMPPTECITKHLFPTVSVLRQVPGGLLSESFGPFGVGGGDPAQMTAVVGIGLGLMLPAVSRVRESARRAQCKSNLRQIGLAIAMWADDNKEEYPPNFKALYPEYVDNALIFVCPSGQADYKDFETGKVSAKSSSYIYIPGLRSTVPGTFFLAYEKPENHRVGINIVFSDAHVEWRLLGPAFDKELRLQKRAVAIWNKGGRKEDLGTIYRRLSEKAKPKAVRQEF
jgi:Protein of unknown function (DUF1559)/Protein of unknown function (DUF3352)